jgi:hypothetical protein
MNVQDIISNALIQYDTVQPIVRHLKKNTYYGGEKTDNNWKRTVFTFTDKKTEEIILETEVELLAIYYDKYKIWSWAWAQADLLESENYLSKEILIYALKLGSELSYIKSILTTSRGVIKDVTQVDINLAIASSIIKQPYIYPFVYSIENYNLVYYFILLNKDGLDKIKNEIEKNK